VDMEGSGPIKKVAGRSGSPVESVDYTTGGKRPRWKVILMRETTKKTQRKQRKKGETFSAGAGGGRVVRKKRAIRSREGRG